MSDILGKITGLVLAVILCVIAPLVIAIMADDMSDKRTIYSEMTNFVDEVVDTSTINKTQLEDFYAAINAHGPICEVRLTRYVRAANPDGKGDIEITYMPTDITVGTTNSDIISKFNQGDLISVTVVARDYTGVQKVGRSFVGGFMAPLNYTVTARVR